MDHPPLVEEIVGAFDSLPDQLQAAARYLLDHPHDVALLSMREQARQAGVQPATMTRLAKRLGREGYDEIRALYAEAMRGESAGFAGKAGAQVARQKLNGDRALASDMLATLGAQAANLAEPASLEALAEAAKRIAAARRVYCLGLRSSHAVAWHLHYILSMIGDKSVLLDSVGGTGGDRIGRAGSQDLLVAASVRPYTRQTVELARYAAGRGVAVVAITDSPVAPLAQVAGLALVVPTDSPSFFHAMAPAFMVAEILGALVAGREGDAALDALQRFDDQLAAFGVHLKSRAPRP
ncbi:MurR/RpiR family transcriptional regulator [Pseudaminobacter sp. 19-2017]|uniref:MurR/RpiR family transcriptional regulator n=1 Tax=Pseudaminobacter soli (ex Zhang et al. 2022) TaxID=2831468 RepID=A0A942E269_9HYPH|nr:MurR/RpiR family transcriptional regulator [Pseudaminobacter soli]MBS3647187.1 MurR/RpiR family transcriptional regulator [Pseudaminobacter soli]